MIDIMGKYTIIKLKKEGQSNRAVERFTGIDRKTVSKYGNEHAFKLNQLSKAEGAAVAEIPEAIFSHPSYDASNHRSCTIQQHYRKQLNAIHEGGE